MPGTETNRVVSRESKGKRPQDTNNRFQSQRQAKYIETNAADEKILNDLNKKFDGKIYSECEIAG